ncbi:T9SS type A sorting domain-containing protein [Aquimarina agarivorans]|uniref:T9SS type A sorting domain-containing protein n=1 Tax=Aquimarina agarivorans TaxID=980584 RepID=UPI000248F27A|nr:T9SS type A sorting domain-containing protein [Aquimarina agarivorans]
MIKSKSASFNRSFSKHITAVLAFFIFNISFIHSKTIFFDTAYGNSGNIASKIQKAINSAADGDIIVFNSPKYNFDGATIVTINKAITFRGKTPVNGFNANKRGASGIRTVWNNTSSFLLRSDNIKFANVSIIKKNLGEDIFDILIDARHTTYLAPNPIAVTQEQYKGIEFQNVILDGGAYSIHTGNGIGLKMTNSSLINYRRIGYWANRFGRTNFSRKASLVKCEIKPDGTVGFDDRAISLDAGNSEYPTIWNFRNTLFKNCLIEDSGIALSRIENVTIEGCTFNDTTGAVDLVHIEEFSNDIRVRNNTFNCRVKNTNNSSRIVQLDRELQVSSDLEFINNRIVGTYNFFISAYAPSKITITGNNFTKANAVNNNAIDFSFYEARSREPIPNELASNDIKIVNNPGLNLPKNKGIRMNIPRNNAKIEIKGVPNSLRRITRITPAAAILPNGIYTITNKANGKKLTASGSGIVTTNGNGANTQWRITFNPPYTYHIQNVGNKRYLETHLGYTEFDIINDKPQNIFPFLNAATGALPFWAITKSGNDYEFFPGGNEKQSILSTNGSKPINLVHGVGIDRNYVRFVIPIKNAAKWSIKPVSASTPAPTNPNPGNGNTQNAPIGKIIWLKSNNGASAYVSARKDEPFAPLRAIATRVAKWEQFLVVDAGNGKVHLKAMANNKYVQARINENSQLVARSTNKNGWETFTWESKAGNRVVLKAFNDKYVTARLGITSKELGAISNKIGGWDTYTWGVVNNSGQKIIDATIDSQFSGYAVYPNPANVNEMVTIEGATTNEMVTIYGINGQLIDRKVVDSNNQIDVTHLSTGIYFLKINAKTLKLSVK